MIKGLLSSYKEELGENVQRGLEWLRINDLDKFSDGRYAIDGEKIFVSIQSYETKRDALFEAHRKYMDIQYMIEGEEKIGVANYSECKNEIPYDSIKDIEFLSSNKTDNYQLLKKGEFLILCPNDAHKPSIAINNPNRVKKAVVKVLI